METLNFIQGTPEWHAHRRTAKNASEAAAALGVSPHMTRTGLLAIMKTGVRPEPTPIEQERFNDGHRVEAALRPSGEKILGQELYPITGTAHGLSASFDGITAGEDIVWECKTLNEALRAVMNGHDLATDDGAVGRALPIHYQVQMEQQLLISGAEKVLFSAGEVADDGTVLDERHCWYYPNLELRARIVAGWAQFDKDLASFELPAAEAPRIVAMPMESLPAVLVNVKGALTVESNLAKVAPVLRAFIDKIPTKPSTDQEFADTEAACKALKTFEEALDAEEARALASIEDVQTLRQLKAELRELARTTRLAREKLVDVRKREIRLEIHHEFTQLLATHVAGLNEALGHAYMPRCEGDWAGVMKGKKTVASLREACSTELANAKIGADEVFRRIQQNLLALREKATAYKFLFADTATLVLKPCEDAAQVIDARIANHKAEEERKERETRERLEREAREKVEREAREAQEAEARRQREAEAAAQRTQAQPPAAAPIASPAPALQPAAPTTPAANSPVVVPIQRGKPSLRLGQINERIAPLAITAAGLEALGFKAAGKEGAAVLFHEADFPAMVDSMVASLRTAQHRQLQAA